MPRNTRTDDPSDEPVRFPRRAQAARHTRDALVRAAAELFAEHGYSATTIQAIAAHAGVARPTVFTSVPGGKPQLLKEARDRALAGDDEPIPVPERPWFRHAMSQTDPYELIRLQAGNYRRILDRAARLERALTIAASQDPALAELHQQAQQQRRHGALAVSTRLDELRALPSDLDAEQAADTIYALASPDVYLLLVRDRAWSPDNYERWLAKRLQQSLIHDH